MPRFPVAFGRRKSTADELQNGQVTEPTFRVLERTEVPSGKSFDGGARLSRFGGHAPPKANVADGTVEDNLFADLKTNRGSGSSNTTKTTSTDNSSRHSNVSTTPSSSAENGMQEDGRNATKKAYADIPMPPVPKSSSSGFLKAAGRTFSFGGQKKTLPPVPSSAHAPADSHSPPMPPEERGVTGGNRARTATASTASTATPPKLESGDIDLDMGGDFGNMLFSFDKRASVATLKNNGNGREALAPRSLTASRNNQPSPIQVDNTSKVEASQYSWSSQHSNEQLINTGSDHTSPTNENAPPPVPKHSTPSPVTTRQERPVTSHDNGLKRSSAIFGRRRSNTVDYAEAEMEDEDTMLLKDSIAASSVLADHIPPLPKTSRYWHDDDTSVSSWRAMPEESKSRVKAKQDGDNLFDDSLSHSTRAADRFVSSHDSPQRNKIMTPAQFERYRQDKERQVGSPDIASQEPGHDEEDNYEDDEDDVERSKQLAKQRRKQEAHMTVYRQQMMKVTGESSSLPASRPGIQISMSTPNLPNLGVGTATGGSDGSDEDEEVPLAILAAHGFPNKNRPPTRLSTMISNPNLRATVQQQRPVSVAGDNAASSGNLRLPPFARNLPQDPYLGAGLSNPAVRENLALGRGSPSPAQSAPLPPGGLVGVIASEERSRALRRGSPHLDSQGPITPRLSGVFDHAVGISPHMMYPMAPPQPLPQMMLTPGDQAQIQMTQQMQQFMQMQMQFMQIMASGQGQGGGGMMSQPGGQMPGHPIGPVDMTGRQSVMGDSMDGPLRPLSHMRTMSMVQPSSASWIQPPGPSYAPSNHVPGIGYATSIAPSERSNIGLPGRYRPVSHAPLPQVFESTHRTSTMSGALGSWDDTQSGRGAKGLVRTGEGSDDDEEEGWEAMRAERDKKRSLWRTKKSLGAELGSLIS